MYWNLFEKGIRAQYDMDSISIFLNILISRVSNELYAQNVVLWFLPTLFFSRLLMFLIVKFHYKHFSFLVSILLLLLGYYLNIQKIILPFTIETSFISTFIVLLGYEFQRNIISGKFKNVFTSYNFLISIIIFLVCYFISDDISMLGHQYGCILIFIFGALSGNFIVVFFSFIIQKFNSIKKYFIFLGKNSLVLMCLHEPVKRVIIKIISILFYENIYTIRKSLTFSLIILILLIMFFIPIIYVVNKYCPFIIGKKGENKL